MVPKQASKEDPTSPQEGEPLLAQTARYIARWWAGLGLGMWMKETAEAGASTNFGIR
jgi:hypothetical protein